MSATVFDDFEFDADDLNVGDFAFEEPEPPPCNKSPSKLFRKPNSNVLRENIPAQNLTEIISPEIRSQIDSEAALRLRKSTITSETKKIAIKRKFPGPAGILPPKPPHLLRDSPVIDSPVKSTTSKDSENIIYCSQPTTAYEVSDPPFEKLKSDYQTEAVDSPLKRLTIEWIKTKALGRRFSGRKIPFLGVSVKSIDTSGSEPIISLQDSTGSISGILHRNAMLNKGDKIIVGSALALREVGVLNIVTKGKESMLNITENNILAIYTPCENGEVSVDILQEGKPSEIVSKVRDWFDNYSNSPMAAPSNAPRSPALFQLVSSSPLGRPNQVPPRRLNVDVPRNVPVISESAKSFIDSLDLECNDEFFDKLDNEISQIESTQSKNNVMASQSQALSQAEVSMLDEVLSGVDFDDF